MSGENDKNEEACDEAVNLPPEAVQVDSTKATALSSVTAVFHDAEKSPSRKLTASGMGLPPTPQCRSIKMLNEEAMEDGYDSDGQLGPFIAKGVADEVDYCMDEQPLETENLNLLALDKNETFWKLQC